MIILMCILMVGVIIGIIKIQRSAPNQHNFLSVVMVVSTLILFLLGVANSRVHVEYVPVPTNSLAECEQNVEVVNALRSCVAGYSHQNEAIEKLAVCIGSMQTIDDIFVCVEDFASNLASQYK